MGRISHAIILQYNCNSHLEKYTMPHEQRRFYTHTLRGSCSPACSVDQDSSSQRRFVRYFSEIAKRLYVTIAQREFAIPGKPQTNTRIATLTGLSRKEVLRVVGEKGPKSEADLTDQHNRATRVISGWVRSSEFHDKRGMPAALPFDGTGKSFSALVKRFSGDIPARTILDELLHSERGEISEGSKDTNWSPMPISRHRTAWKKIKMLGTDVSDLINTINHNLTTEGSASRFQRKVS